MIVSGHGCHVGRGRSLGRGHVGHLCEESNHERDEDSETGGEENERGGGHDHDQNQSAMKQMAECEPTIIMSVTLNGQ